MLKKTFLVVAGLIVLSWGVGYTWTSPVRVSPLPPAGGPAKAWSVTPTSQAVQRQNSSQVRALFNCRSFPPNGDEYWMYQGLSANGGSSWTSWGQVYADPTGVLSQYSPSLVRVGGVLHATWYQIGQFYRAEIFYARSTDFGATWSVYHPDLWKNQFLVVSASDEFPHLAVSSNGQQVVIVWRQTPSDPSFGPLVRVWSTDGGLSWNSLGPTQIGSEQAYLPNVTYTSYNVGRFVVVYSKWGTSPRAIYSTYTTDGGASWSTPIEVTCSYSPTREFPTVSYGGDRLMCVWQYPGAVLVSNFSLNGGENWRTQQGFTTTYPPNDQNVSPWQSLAFDPCTPSFLCTWASKVGSQKYNIYVSEYLLYLPGWPEAAPITNNLNNKDTHGPRVSTYPSPLGVTNRFITFANGNDPSNLSVWESKSSCIPTYGGGGQSKGVVPRGEESAPMVRVTPNPAKGFVTIRYSLGESNATVTLKVYSITGQLVKTVSLEGGSTRELTWNLKDEGGKPVANGVYLLRLDGSEVHLSERMVVLR